MFARPFKALLGAVALVASLTSLQAFAHAHLQSETPAANSSVSAPQSLRLVFSEGVEAAFTRVEVTRDGSAVAIAALATDPANRKILLITPNAPLTAGLYKVSWHAVSVDTHKSEGDYSFNVHN